MSSPVANFQALDYFSLTFTKLHTAKMPLNRVCKRSLATLKISHNTTFTTFEISPTPHWHMMSKVMLWPIHLYIFTNMPYNPTLTNLLLLHFCNPILINSNDDVCIFVAKNGQIRGKLQNCVTNYPKMIS